MLAQISWYCILRIGFFYLSKDAAGVGGYIKLESVIKGKTCATINSNLQMNGLYVLCTEKHMYIPVNKDLWFENKQEQARKHMIK